MEEAGGWIIGFLIVVAAVVWLIGIVLTTVYWVFASIAFLLLTCFDGLTSLPSAPAVMWAIWGGVIGAALGFWTIAPVYGVRKFRALILAAPFVLMLGFSAVRAMASIPRLARGARCLPPLGRSLHRLQAPRRRLEHLTAERANGRHHERCISAI